MDRPERRHAAGRGAAPRRADARGAVARTAVNRVRLWRAGWAAWLALAAAVVLAAPARIAHADPLDAGRIVRLTNGSRRQAGVKPVTMDERLMAAARAKLFDMLKKDYFAHRAPDGRQP